jgi:diphthine synthase
MAELWFIGLGLGDERDVSRRAMDVLRSGAAIYAEEYTAVWSPGAFDRLSREVGRPVQMLTREEVESERPILSALAQGGNVAFLAVGDPFSATTHIALRLAAERAGYPTHYLPNASILSAAAGVLGLIPYRFGRTVSLPFPEPGFAPTSPIDAIARNRLSGLHTLVLLDLRPAEGRFLTASEALGVLRERDREERVISGELKVAVLARVGRADQATFFGPIDTLRKLDFGAPMHALVVPAPELHFQEAEALARFGPGRR